MPARRCGRAHREPDRKVQLGIVLGAVRSCFMFDLLLLESRQLY